MIARTTHDYAAFGRIGIEIRPEGSDPQLAMVADRMLTAINGAMNVELIQRALIGGDKGTFTQRYDRSEKINGEVFHVQLTFDIHSRVTKTMMDAIVEDEILPHGWYTATSYLGDSDQPQLDDTSRSLVTSLAVGTAPLTPLVRDALIEDVQSPTTDRRHRTTH
jgi:hypothetical protein